MFNKLLIILFNFRACLQIKDFVFKKNKLMGFTLFIFYVLGASLAKAMDVDNARFSNSLNKNNLIPKL